MDRPKSPSLDPDLEALRRCRQGDRQAFAELVERHQNGVFRLIHRWVGQKERAEELAQDVFLKAFRDLSNFREESKFSTWIYQITLNRCRDYWRSQRRGSEKSFVHEAIHSQPSEDPSPETEAVSLGEAGRLRQALDELPGIYRDALSLRYFGDRNYEEMSEISGEGVSNLKMRVARGLAQLRKKLEELK
ncbi:MAG: sigma-70 family RNA polymerase sigma factor [Deltaproteobacteria bacterium]|nr:sigma-70 family RNA polymerase sigma factor [Deltaproteobacteria bacterium]